jgi:transposase
LECLNQPGVGGLHSGIRAVSDFSHRTSGAVDLRKLTETQRERLLDLFEEGEPCKKQEIQDLVNQEFDIEFHPNYLPRLLDDLDLSSAVPRTERPDRPENAEEILGERVESIVRT